MNDPKKEEKRMYSWSPCSTNMLLLDLIEIIRKGMNLPPIEKRDYDRILKEIERREP